RREVPLEHVWGLDDVVVDGHEDQVVDLHRYPLPDVRVSDTTYPGMAMPPSTHSTWPVTIRESSEAKNSAAPVMSSGCSSFFIAVIIVTNGRNSSGTCLRVASVMVSPGAT